VGKMAVCSAPIFFILPGAPFSGDLHEGHNHG
jgi:hypothetical protein